jgi:twitching motility two-component system response regulator PilH
MRILVVDDSHTDRYRLRKILEGQGHDCYEAESGEEALSLMGDILPDVVFMDVVMPGMDGFQTLAKLEKRSLSPHAYVVMQTLKNRAEEAVRAFRQGADDYIVKPVTVEKLAQVMQDMEAGFISRYRQLQGLGHVFLSYASVDRPIANAMYDRLEKVGVKAWIDHRDIPKGSDWFDSIVEAIKKSSHVLFIVTSNFSVDSKILREEIRIAKERDRLDSPKNFLIPLRFDECEMPQDLARLQWIDFESDNDKRNDKDGFGVLLEVLLASHEF